MISVTTPHLLGDAGVNPRFFSSSWDCVFSTGSVSKEANNNLGQRLETSILNTYTYKDFKKIGGCLTVTGMWDNTVGNYDVESLSMITFSNTPMTSATEEFPKCPHCQNSTIVELINDKSGQRVYLCNSVVSSTGDFSLAVQAIAFPDEFTIVTEDGCLGAAFYSFSSFSPTKGFWGQNLKLKETKTYVSQFA